MMILTKTNVSALTGWCKWARKASCSLLHSCECLHWITQGMSSALKKYKEKMNINWYHISLWFTNLAGLIQTIRGLFVSRSEMTMTAYISCYVDNPATGFCLSQQACIYFLTIPISFLSWKNKWTRVLCDCTLRYGSWWLVSLLLHRIFVFACALYQDRAIVIKTFGLFMEIKHLMV